MGVKVAKFGEFSTTPLLRDQAFSPEITVFELQKRCFSSVAYARRRVYTARRCLGSLVQALGMIEQMFLEAARLVLKLNLGCFFVMLQSGPVQN